MSPSATGSAPERRQARRRAQRGATLPVVIGLMFILSVLVAASLFMADSGTGQATRSARGDLAVQVADAGLNQYIARLVEDPRYWDHYVDPAEDPRVAPNGTVYPPGSAWPTGTSWTYSGPPQTRKTVQNARFGQSTYSLRITAPVPGSDVVGVQAHAEVGLDTPRPFKRTLQARVAPSSIADFQMISNTAIKYGSTATTTGKVYSAVSVNHMGSATAPIYGQVAVCSESSGTTCSGHSYNAAQLTGGVYDSLTSPSFSEKFPTPIDFSQFTRSMNSIRDAAQNGGVYRNDSSAAGWLVQFRSDGTVKIAKVTGTSLSTAISSIACPTTVTVPANGAMYFEQPVVVSSGSTMGDACGGTGPRDSVVDGRVTIATPGNLYIGGNISYETSGDDVLGLIAGNSIIFTKYTPATTTVRAATLAQFGQWITATGSADGLHSVLTYIGSQTTNQGGYASMFTTRNYQYDTVLRYLRPPFYPIIEGSWETENWREVADPS
ncbi:MAG: hypothetical protein AB1416_04000 [Actinomycetota bacterium]